LLSERLHALWATIEDGGLGGIVVGTLLNGKHAAVLHSRSLLQVLNRRPFVGRGNKRVKDNAILSGRGVGIPSLPEKAW
jgi:hypothetical protein